MGWGSVDGIVVSEMASGIQGSPACRDQLARKHKANSVRREPKMLKLVLEQNSGWPMAKRNEIVWLRGGALNNVHLALKAARFLLTLVAIKIPFYFFF